MTSLSPVLPIDLPIGIVTGIDIEANIIEANTIEANTIEATVTAPSPLVTPGSSLPNAGIVGLGMCVPDHIVTNHDIAQLVETQDEWIVSRTGIRERRVADENTMTSDLAVIAAQRALANAGILAEDIDLILCATTSGDYIWPSTACVVQHRLGARRAAAFDLSAACSGFCYGLATAAGFIQTGAMRCVLVIGADTLSKQVNWQDRGTCILFGDGAGAAVLTPCSPDSGILASALGADGSGLESVWIPAGGTRTPVTPEALEQKLNTISMRGQEVYRFAVRVVPEVVEAALHKVCLRPCDVDLLVLHQANARIIESAAERLGIPIEKVVINLDRYGNTSAASVPLALAEAAQQDRLKKNDIIVTVGFGAGLTWAANVIRWSR